MKKRIFFLILIFSVFAIVVIATTKETFGLNKTVGWAWDLSNMQWWIGVGLSLGIFVLIIFLSYRFVMFLFKQLQNKKD